MLPLPPVLALAGKPSVVLSGVLLPLLFHELGKLAFLLQALVSVQREVVCWVRSYLVAIP